VTPYLKTKQNKTKKPTAKRTGNMAQMAECLPSKCKALSSSAKIAKKISK
jgi:hypothetical protein